MSEKRRVRASAGTVLPTGEVVELLYRPGQTLFLVGDKSGVREERFVDLPSGLRLVPYSPENNLLVHEVVLLPSETLPYGTEESLIAEVTSFIHRYVDLSPEYEEAAAWYVLFTWVYDSFNELPYLRVRGDYGSGKSRFLLTVGSLCYKPIFASGASTVSPIFRILDAFRGTLVIDEGDFRFSDEKAEVVKILNNGNARGFPILRSEQTPTKEFNPTAFTVFGPKLVATRGFFTDRALESRCITEELGGRPLRTDIPINLPEEMGAEARELRNKLLSYRFTERNRPRNLCGNTLGVEPRIAQILRPLLSVVTSPDARVRLFRLGEGLSRELVRDRAALVEAQVLEVLVGRAAEREVVAVKEIAEGVRDRFGEDFDRPVTPRFIGQILRTRLFLKPFKRHGAFVLALSDRAQLRRLCEKYGVDLPGGEGDMGRSSRESDASW